MDVGEGALVGSATVGSTTPMEVVGDGTMDGRASPFEQLVNIKNKPATAKINTNRVICFQYISKIILAYLVIG
jgi:hypothetical protein